MPKKAPHPNPLLPEEREPEYLDKLTPQQRKAVTYTGGPLMIVAGAGTGKTTVLTNRIAWLIEQGIAPSKILALTFTEKAAAEMQARLDELLPLGQNEVFCATYHGFGQHVLRNYARGLAQPDDTGVLTEAQTRIVIGDAIMQFPLQLLRPLSNPKAYIPAIMQFMSRCKDELISPEDVMKWAKKAGAKEDKQTYTELAAAYQFYQQLLEKKAMLDYGDLLFRTHALLTDTTIRQKLQQQFTHILVDEYQDTNFAQCEIVRLLAQNSAITVVGDDDQAIYRFRGAASGQMERFLEDFPKTKLVTLTENFRSPQSILDAAYALIQHNNPYRLEVSANISKKLTALSPQLPVLRSSTGAQDGRTTNYLSSVAPQERRMGELPTLHIFSTDLDESAWVIADIEARVKRGAHLGDHCILVRTNAHSQPFMRDMERQGIPYITQSQSLLKNDGVVRLLLNFLNALVDPSDALSLFFLATSPLYNIPGRVLIPYLAEARSKHQSLEALLTITSDTATQKMLTELNQARDQLHRQTTSQLLLDWIKKHHSLKILADQSTDDGTHLAQILTSFFRLINQFEQASQFSDVFHFLQSLEVLFDDFDGDENRVFGNDHVVKLFTVHTAKGLEFPIVYCTNLASERFPLSEKHNGFAVPRELLSYVTAEGEHAREERRLLYVAMTRAKDELILTRAEKYGKGRPRKPSVFLSEFPYQLPDQPNYLSSVAPEERRMGQLHTTHYPLHLTPHQIEDYLNCPLRYKYAHIDKLPPPESQSRDVGQAIHLAINHFFRAHTHHKPPTLASLKQIVTANWPETGFISAEHQAQRKVDVLNQIALFYDTFSKLPLPILHEHPFEINVEGVRLRGRIDAYFDAPLPGGDATPIILDFKTADTVTTQDAADRRAESSIQLTIYAFAWRARTGVTPSVALYFTKSGLFGWSTRSERKLANLETKIAMIADNIATEQFEATPSSITCGLCPFKTICPQSLAS